MAINKMYPNIVEQQRVYTKSFVPESIHSPLLDVMCTPHPVTGMTVNFMTLLNSPDVADDVKDYIRKNLMREIPLRDTVEDGNDFSLIPPNFMTSDERVSFLGRVKDYLVTNFGNKSNDELEEDDVN